MVYRRLPRNAYDVKIFLHKVSNTLRRSRVLVGVPCGMTDVEQRAMMDAVIQAGAREVFLIERPVAAAIGSGLPILRLVDLWLLILVKVLPTWGLSH